MADVVVTAANVAPTTGANGTTYGSTLIAGEALSAGALVYIKAADNKYWLADANLSAEASTIAGMVMQTSVSAGQPCQPAVGGEVTAGGTLVAGMVYILSATTGGKYAPATDIAAGWLSSRLGVAKTTAILRLDISNSGITA